MSAESGLRLKKAGAARYRLHCEGQSVFGLSPFPYRPREEEYRMGLFTGSDVSPAQAAVRVIPDEGCTTGRAGTTRPGVGMAGWNGFGAGALNRSGKASWPGTPRALAWNIRQSATSDLTHVAYPFPCGN